MGTRTYTASCHCGAVRFRFTSLEITDGRTCNCSICSRKGVVMSASYYRPGDVRILSGEEHLGSYSFGDRHVNHHFCRTCGISPFNVVAGVPAEYEGPARPGDYRINLGCVHELDLSALEISVIDGRSF